MKYVYMSFVSFPMDIILELRSAAAIASAWLYMELIELEWNYGISHCGAGNTESTNEGVNVNKTKRHKLNPLNIDGL